MQEAIALLTKLAEESGTTYEALLNALGALTDEELRTLERVLDLQRLVVRKRSSSS